VAEVLIEGRRLDVNEGLDFSFNYSISDIRDPNKRSTSFSKTIKCPSTKRNDILFGQIYDVNISNDYNPSNTNIEVNFNPNKKAQATVLHDGVAVMEGVVQLRAITVNNGRYDYEVVFIGKLKNVFSEIGDKKLNDVDTDGNPLIDFSDLDHGYNSINIANSWTNTTGYVYPMIDYGIRFEYETNGNRIYDIECWRPSVFLKDIFDRIFDYAGFTYTSNFLSSSPFTNLIVPFHAEEYTLTDTQIEARQFIAESTADQDIMTVSPTVINVGNLQFAKFHMEYDDFSDPNNLWNPTTDEYTANELGYYDFTVNSTFSVSLGAPGVIPATLRLIRTSNLVESVIDEVQFDLDEPTTSLNWTSQQQLLYIGDTVRVEILISYTVYQVAIGLGSTVVQDAGSRLSNRVAEQTIFEGAEMYMNNFVPDVKMKDILLGVFKMFNLYVTVDQLNETNLIIETRDEYYSGGVIRDWSKKLARDKQIKLKPLGLLAGKEYLYTYSDDSDYYNKRYENNRGEVYGTRDYEIDNDFLKNTNKVEVAFSATPLVNDGNSNRIIPKIYDEDIDDGAKPVDINMRVLYYAGLLTSAPSWTFRYNAETTSDIKNRYPYAGHLDNPLTPSLDLNFGIPSELYYTSNGYTGSIQYTNANLFNLYHSSHIREITNKDAKVLTGEFHLDAFDIEKLDFRDQILIDNSYWRINKVNDYNPFKEGLTKVELFKVLDLVQQEPQPFLLGRSGVIISGDNIEKKPYPWRNSRSNFNLFSIGKGSVNGRRNRVSEMANNYKIIGDDNYISGGSDKVFITGNNNQVLNGAKNVNIINSDNQIVSTDNVTIIDGKKQWETVAKDVDYTAKDRDLVLADSSKAAPPITITLPTLAEGLWVCVKKTDATASNVDITAGVSGTIDGAATHSLTSQYDSVELFCDGSNWFIRSDK